MSDTVTKIAAMRAEIANSVREYVRSQLDIWKTIPWLTIEAQGRGGWADSYATAFYGLWRVNGADGCYTLHVDCHDGGLLYGLEPVGDALLVQASGWLDSLNASKIAEYLKARSLEEYTGSRTADENEAMKRTWRINYCITPVYSRLEPLPTDWRDIGKYMKVV